MDGQSVNKILSFFENRYKNPVPKLEYNTPFQLLIAVILSAQCTDERVNKVTKNLFSVCDTPEKMAAITQEDLEKIIFSCGLYHTKAQHIIAASRAIVEKFGGVVPGSFEQLVTLDGVGRKTANVVSSVAFGKNAIAVDTHVFRVSNRIGLVSADTPFKTEMQLKEVFPENKWSKCHHYLIFYGREVCTARNPKCAECGISDLCEYDKKNL